MTPAPRMSDEDWGKFRENLGREFAELRASIKSGNDELKHDIQDIKDDQAQHNAMTGEIHAAIHADNGILDRLRLVESKLTLRWKIWTAIGGAAGFLLYGVKWLWGYLTTGGKSPVSPGH